MSQVLTRSRGQLKKATAQTAPVPRLRKKVAPKLVSTRPKRSRNSPPKDTTTPSNAFPQDDSVSAVHSPSGSESVAVSSPHECSNASIPQSNMGVNTPPEPVLLIEERHLTNLDTNFDLRPRPSDLDDMFANQQTESSVAADNTSDALASENTVTGDALNFIDNHPYEASYETPQRENEARGNETTPPSLYNNLSKDTERECVVSTCTINATPGDDVTDVGVVKTPEKQKSGSPSRASKKVRAE